MNNEGEEWFYGNLPVAGRKNPVLIKYVLFALMQKEPKKSRLMKNS